MRHGRRTACEVLLAAAVALAALGGGARPGGPVAEASGPEVAASGPARSAYWVFFRDKNLGSPAAEGRAVAAARAGLAPRTLSRRLRAGRGEAADVLDVPVAAPYVRLVLAGGARHRTTSRWLNAVSVEATPAELAAIRALPFVGQVRPVARGRGRPEPITPVALPPRSAEPRGGHVPSAPHAPVLNYGECASQILPIQVDQLHDAGFSGAGVLVCIMDTGFERLHRAVASADVVAEHDFINDDDVTSNEPGDDPSQHDHGTCVLSVIAGYDPGYLIGPAFGASFLLAKTEDITSETPVEEDYWVEAAEWAEGLGADVFTTSLCYIDWYTYRDLDGDTALITIAADLAAAHGVAVFNAAGNYGSGAWYYVGPAADGDSVLAIGAVDSSGAIASFSSRGPTWDGRTKPDVCAMGVSDLVAVPGTVDQYGRGSGTSFSCPLAAGVGALLLEAVPDRDAGALRDALRSTATRAASPDNDYGWGIIQGRDALLVLGGGGVEPPVSTGLALSVSPNPSAGEVRFGGRLGAGESSAGAAAPALDIFDVRGRLVRRLATAGWDAGRIDVVWDGRDAAGKPARAGLYFARLTAGGRTITRRVVRVP